MRNSTPAAAVAGCVLLALAPALAAQCASCPQAGIPLPAYRPQASPLPPASPSYSWHSDGSGGHGLYLGESQVGWADRFGTYYPRLGRGSFGAASRPPVPSPAAPAARRGECCGASSCKCEPGDCQCGKTRGLCCDACTCAIAAGERVVSADANFGVELDKLGRGTGYSKNGKPCTRREAIQALEKGLVDDSHLPRLTVIGPKEARERVLADLESSPALAPFRGRFLVQGYDPSNWSLQGLGFVTTGAPTIYAQLPDGTVSHRQDDYAGGAERLAQALRKADPGYDPKKDPDLSKAGPLGVDWKNLPWPAIAVIGVAAYLLLRKGD